MFELFFAENPNNEVEEKWCRCATLFFVGCGPRHESADSPSAPLGAWSGRARQEGCGEECRARPLPFFRAGIEEERNSETLRLNPPFDPQDVLPSDPQDYPSMKSGDSKRSTSALTIFLRGCPNGFARKLAPSLEATVAVLRRNRHPLDIK